MKQLNLKVFSLLFFICALALSACSNKNSAPQVKDGKVHIKVTDRAFVPNTVEAPPDSKLEMIFTRVSESECGKFVKVGDSKKQTELPLNKPVSITVEVPKDGKVRFACGMDMMTGVIIAKP